MTKTIKFNLICDDTPIRTIEDLQNNFSIEDVLAYYRNGLLQRWLEVRGYEKELKKVTDIKVEDSLGIIKELIKVFEISSDEKKVAEGVYMLEFLEEHKRLCSLYEKNKFKADEIINDYQTRYSQLVQGILDNPSDSARIKANIEEIASNYKWAFDLNHRELFWTLIKQSSLAVMCLLMNEKTRDYYLHVKENGDSNDALDPEDTASLSTTKFSNEGMYKRICDLIKEPDFAEKLGDNLIKFAGETEGYWKDLESKGKKYMIISMGSGDFVRSAGVSGGDLSSTDVTNTFVIVDGVDYKSNSASRQLLYMEV